MCGIGGVFCFGKTKLTERDAKRVIELAECLQTRGTDAFGFYNGEKVIKFPSSASDVIEMIDRIRSFEELIVDKKMFLMHTRASTSGDPLKNRNNHPFESKDFVLAHNGILYYDVKYFVKGFKIDKKAMNGRYYYEELDPYEIFGRFEYDLPDTDSFTILVELQKEYNARKDFYDALVETFDNLAYFGEMAVWVYCKKTKELALFRDSRPLIIGEDNGKLWFASEEWMLKRIGVKSIKPMISGELRIYNPKGRVFVDVIPSARKGREEKGREDKDDEDRWWGRYHDWRDYFWYYYP